MKLILQLNPIACNKRSISVMKFDISPGIPNAFNHAFFLLKYLHIELKFPWKLIKCLPVAAVYNLRENLCCTFCIVECMGIVLARVPMGICMLPFFHQNVLLYWRGW